MKKLLAFVLVLALCLSLCTGLTACVQKETGSSTTSTQSGLDAALMYVKTLYKETTEKTSRDFTRIGSVPVNGQTYEVVWSVDVAEEFVKVVKNADGTVTIDVNETSPEEVHYTLTATIKDGDKVVSYSWKHIVPKVNLDFGAIVDEAYALEQGASMDYEVTLTGVINKVDTPYDDGYKNVTVTMDVVGIEGKPIQCYRLKGEGAENLKPGDTITVSGILTNYQGKIQFQAGCVLLSVTSAGEVEAPTDVATIMKEAFELPEGGSTQYQATLTGKITKINTPYNPSFKNVSVTIEIEGYEGKELLCYRVKGEGADSLLIGDTITVKGYIVNYKGGVQFGEGSSLLKVEKTGSEVKAPSDPKQIVKEAYALKEDETLPYKATLTGKITKVNEYYNPSFGNITVTIVVAGMNDKPIKVYRLAGKGVENEAFGEGDTITVTGMITNYKGEVEFAQGCTLDKWENTNTAAATYETLTVKQAIDMALASEHNVYSDKKYQVTGVITEVYNTQYGNMKITDADGNILTLYGTYSKDGKDRYDAMSSKPDAGDTVTVLGVVGNFNGTPQIKNGWILSFKEGEAPKVPSAEELGIPAEDGAEITIKQANAAGEKIPHNMFTETKYKVTGVIKEVYNADYGNMYIVDAEGNQLTVYGTFNADGSVSYKDMAVKPIAGDTITVYGILGQYNGTAQIKNGWIVAHTPYTGDKYEVTFDLNYETDAEAPAKLEVPVDGTYGTLPVPEREGYTFEGWFLTADCTGEAVEATTVVTKSHTLYAKWTEKPAAPQTGLVAGKPYIFGMTQGNLENKVYYLAGGMAQTYYLATTEDANAAIEVYVEETEGGYYFYTLDGETKLYINMVVSGTHVNGAYEAAASTVYTYDEAHNTLIAVVNDADYWFGTRNDKQYTTMGPCALSNNGFYGEFYEVSGGVTPEPTPEATPEVTPEPTPEATPEVTPEPTPEETDPPAETGLVAGKPYIFGMTQGNLENKVYYLAGGMAQTYYLATTEDANAAIEVYVEETAGGYYFYTLDGETKLYINMVVSGTHVNGVYEATASTVYTYDAEHNTLIAEVSGEDYWIGTRNDKNYTTMGPNKVSFNGFYGEFYEVSGGVTPEPTPEATPEVTPEPTPEPTPEETDPPAETGLVAGKPYIFGMTQGNLENKVYYLAGGMAQTYYLATTEDAAAAIEVYVEETAGGYYFYTMDGNNKLYINMVVSGTHVNGVYEATASTVYTYDEAHNTLIAVVNDADYWFGTRNDKQYTTMGPCALSNNGFYGEFYEVSGGVTPEPTPEATPEVTPEPTPEPTPEATPEETDPPAPPVAGGSADFNTIVTSNANGDSSYNKTFTTANGWTVENSAIQTGGATVMNPQYPVIGPDNTFKAVCLNGKTSAFGKLTSPTLTTGISKLTIQYTKVFTDTELSVTVTVKDAAGNTYTHVVEKRGIDKNEKYVVYTDEWTLDTPVVGEFTIEVVNNCPTNQDGNKDRMTILSLAWEGAASHTHEYTSTTTATCTEAGVTTYTCACGDTYTEETEKLGHIDENLDVECDREGCTSKVAPPADSLLSNFTANCLGSKLSVDNAYYVEGVIVEVLDQRNGIFLIDDGTGEKFYFRLPKNAEGVSHASWEIKLTTGDKVSVYGKINKYTTTDAPNGQFWPAMQAPVATLLEQHTHDFTAVPATCSKPAYCACGQSHGEPLGCADTDGDSLCDDCGKNVNYIFEYVEIRTDNGSGVHDATANTYTWSGENFGVQVAKASGGNLYTTAKDHMRLYKGNNLVLTSENGKAVKMIVVYLTNATQIGNFEKFLTGYTYTKNEEAFTVTVEVDFADTLTLTNPSSNGSTTQIKGVDFGYEKPGVTPDPVVYDVTFNLNYEGAENNIEKITVEEGAAYGTLPTAAREGYTFGGWYLTAECDGDAVTANTTVSASHTLYAKWTRNVARVFFSLNYTGAAGAPDFITVNVGEAYGTLPADPTREGYTFGGWYTDAACTGEAVKATDTVSADHTLYAKWTANAPVVVAGGSADFSTLDAPNGDQNYAAHTTTNGWKTTNSAILVGGTTDSNPVFKVVGPDKTHKAVCMNGKTSAVGKITSPMLTTGISKLTVKYTMPFSDTKLSVKVTIKDANGQTYATHDIVHNGATKLQAYEHEWVLEAPLVGNFTIEVVNNCPSASTKNKDRFAIISLAWEGAASGGVTPEPTPDTTPGATPEPTPDDTDAPVPPAPQTPAEIVDAAYGLASGATLDGTYTLTGKVTSVKEAYNASFGNVSVWMTVEGKEDKPILCYRMTGTGADEVAAGYTITVTGSLTNYNGTIEFAKGCTLDSYVEGSLGTENMTPSEIVDAAYALETNKTMAGNYTLTGVITSIDNAYSTEFNNITVTMVVEGKEDKPIKCYRMKGSGADVIAIGDTITVSGILKNYDGTVEFDTGCTLDSYEKDGSVVVPPATGDHVEPKDVVYVKGSPSSSNYTNVVKNWGIRGDVATSLSPMATAFYTGTNTYVELAKLSGSSTLSSVPQSNLYTALKTLMVNKHSTITSYDDVRYLFAFTDCERADSTTLSLFYCGENVSSTWNGNTMNREHCWPKSHTSGSTGTTTVDADIMTLRPTKPSNNSDRGNDPYGTASGSFFPNTFTTTYDLRGDCARIVLYTYVRWGETNLTSVIDSVDLLLSWNQIDPVDSWELARNDSVQSITGTRNVFVDYPELAFILFGREVPAGLITPSAA